MQSFPWDRLCNSPLEGVITPSGHMEPYSANFEVTETRQAAQLSHCMSPSPASSCAQLAPTLSALSASLAEQPRAERWSSGVEIPACLAASCGSTVFCSSARSAFVRSPE